MQPHLAMDLHVKSQASRWDGSGYVNDAVTSPTIDGGHPQDAFDNETAPNGNRVNLGAWGNTAQEDYVYYEEDLGTPGQPPDLLPAVATS